MIKRVYIETSIPSFYFTLRTDEMSQARMKWTRQWWNEYADKVELITSAAVIEELKKSSAEKREERIGLLGSVKLLEITEEIRGVTQVYIDRFVMPNDPTGDALHLAAASFHEIDALLTWNCKHLANANKIDHIRKVNDELGLSTPQLTTPLNFLGGNE